MIRQEGYVPDFTRQFASLEEYAAWHKEQYQQKLRARVPRGEKHVHSKLTEEQVAEIRRAYYTGEKSSKDLTSQYGLARNTICRILTGETWAHVEDNLEKSAEERAQIRNARRFPQVLTEDVVRAIRAEYVPGKVRLKDLEKKYGVKLATVSDIIRRKSWKHI